MAPNFSSQPLGGVIQGTGGDLYGTSQHGGVDTFGNLFKVTLDGTLTTLYQFDTAQYPVAGLVQGAGGNFYGTTQGMLFEITPSGSLTTLDFLPGDNSTAPLVQGTDGNLYGANFFSYQAPCNEYSDCGTIFQATPTGAMTTVYTFCSQPGCANGYFPTGLVQATNGLFYGTTISGGAYGAGTIFSFSAGLGPFVKTQTASGKAGSTVEILGTDLTGATAVKFHGVTAAFKVISSSLIAAKVPVGATSGRIEVATPGGTLLSNKPFIVTQ